MKNLIDLSGRNFNNDEYNALRQEINYRLNVIYSYGFSLVSVILVFFSMVLVFATKILEIIIDQNSIFGNSIYVDLTVIFVVTSFCALPVLLVYSYSVKYEDNLRQICNISAFQEVFFEYPSFLANKKDKITAWEFFHRTSSVPKAKMIALEYIAVSIISIILTFSLGLILCLCSCCTNSKIFFDSNHLIGSIITVCLFSILLIGVILALLALTFKIRDNTRSDKILKNYLNYYINIYLEYAKHYGILNKIQVHNFTKLSKEIEKIHHDTSHKTSNKNTTH